MRSIPLGLAVAVLASGLAVAQTTDQTAAPAGSATGAPAMTGSPATNAVVPPVPASGNMGDRPNTAAPVTPMTNTSAPAMRDHSANAAVNAPGNSPTPASGANSFTQGQARKRIVNAGYSNVGALKKDRNGVWRGTAQRNGQTASVWLDYRGDVGQQ